MWDTDAELEARNRNIKYMPYVEVCPLLITRGGLVYNDYKEAAAVEMVEHWLADRMDVLRGLTLIVVEKQLSRMTRGGCGVSERGCLVIETALKMGLRCIPGAPPVAVVAPAVWKRWNEISTGDTHSERKSLGIDRFSRLMGEGHVDKLKDEWGSKIDDCVDSFFMARYARHNSGDLLRKSNLVQNFNSLMLENGQFKRVVVYADRNTGRVSFTGVKHWAGALDLTIAERRVEFATYRLRRKERRAARKSKASYTSVSVAGKKRKAKSGWFANGGKRGGAGSSS